MLFFPPKQERNYVESEEKRYIYTYKMFGWLQNTACACTSRSSNNDDFDVNEFNEDPLGWSRNLQNHHTGEFSMAAVQANDVMEDNLQVETGTQSLFLGIYDGHGGVDASQYVSRTLFPNLLSRLQENNLEMSENILRQAVADTERGFMGAVKSSYLLKPELGQIGSCCLVGFISNNGTIYIANLGDSRAVICSQNVLGRSRVQQLTTDHNVSNESIRNQLKELHPDDPHIVLEERGAWRVKGIIQVSRTIGDAYLKRPQFTLRGSFPKFREVPGTFTRGVLSAEPEIISRVIGKEDKFLIFASDGFWEFMSNDQAAEVVNSNPRNGIAKRLVGHALNKAAKQRRITFKDLHGIDKGREIGHRRSLHDDISVIVVFFDKRGRLRQRGQIELASYRGFTQTVEASDFTSLISTTVAA